MGLLACSTLPARQGLVSDEPSSEEIVAPKESEASPVQGRENRRSVISEADALRYAERNLGQTLVAFVELSDAEQVTWVSKDGGFRPVLENSKLAALLSGLLVVPQREIFVNKDLPGYQATDPDGDDRSATGVRYVNQMAVVLPGGHGPQLVARLCSNLSGIAGVQTLTLGKWMPGPSGLSPGEPALGPSVSSSPDPMCQKLLRGAIPPLEGTAWGGPLPGTMTLPPGEACPGPTWAVEAVGFGAAKVVAHSLQVSEPGVFRLTMRGPSGTLLWEYLVASPTPSAAALALVPPDLFPPHWSGNLRGKQFLGPLLFPQDGDFQAWWRDAKGTAPPVLPKGDGPLMAYAYSGDLGRFPPILVEAKEAEGVLSLSFVTPGLRSGLVTGTKIELPIDIRFYRLSQGLAKVHKVLARHQYIGGCDGQVKLCSYQLASP